MNTLAEANDPTTTFKDKADFALMEVLDLDMQVNALDLQHGQLYMDVNSLAILTEQLNISTVKLIELIAVAERKASPYTKLVQSAEDVIERLKMEIYAGQDLLVSIETVIYPEILTDTEYINDVATQSNVTLDDLMVHLEILENQANKILLLAEQATEAANVSLDTAYALIIISNENNVSLNMAQGVVKELDASISIALQELAAFNLSIIHAQINIANINDGLPDLPSASYIKSLMNETSQLGSQVDVIKSSYSQQLALYESLNSSLSNIQSRYDVIQELLDKTAETVDKYLNALNSTLDKASTASSEAYADFSEAEEILADLRNFSNATAALKAKADEALLLAADINKTVIAVEKVVSDNLSRLQEIRAEIDEILLESVSLKNSSEALETVSHITHTLQHTKDCVYAIFHHDVIDNYHDVY